MSRRAALGEIRAAEVILIDQDGFDCGIITREEAQQRAAMGGYILKLLDLASSPPRCQLVVPADLDRDARREQQSRRATAAPKEIRLRQKTGVHDRATRVRAIGDLLHDGYRVKVTVLLEGSERRNPATARALLDEIVQDIQASGQGVRLERAPFAEKGALSVLLAADLAE